ncbi:RNA-binding protein [Bacteroides reticulotermitis]|uniref:RNA-binding protein n=1 Tax=Bacteroides reticulotermitis TaxID=1133319 RepID=UPI003A83E79B
MRAISVKQPWAYLLCAGIKDIENRTWRLPEKMNGERVLIHASGGPLMPIAGHYGHLFDHPQYETLRVKMGLDFFNKELHTSAIIGSVVFTDCVINHPSAWAEKTEVLADESGLPYYGNPIYNWVSSYPILFDKPILNVKGRLSFWNYPNIGCGPDEEGVQTCNCQLAVDERFQVVALGYEYRCRYCGGKWYK